MTDTIHSLVTQVRQCAESKALIQLPQEMLLPVPSDAFETKGTARFSSCQRYRYVLTRAWDPSLPTILIIGLNPSTADAATNDATVRRCATFARDWGHGSLVLANLFAFRATDPSLLSRQPDPVGPANDSWIRRMVAQAIRVVIAWGVHGSLRDRDREVLEWIPEPFCLGTTKGGHPRHPLYLPRTAQPEPYC